MNAILYTRDGLRAVIEMPASVYQNDIYKRSCSPPPRYISVHEAEKFNPKGIEYRTYQFQKLFEKEGEYFLAIYREV